MHDFERDYAFGVDARPTAYFNDAQQAVFQGFRRANGRIGTRNYIGVLTSVNCSATAARYIADAITPAILGEYPHVAGVVATTHSTRSGLDGDREGYPKPHGE